MKEINFNVKTMHNVEVWLKRANKDNYRDWETNTS